MIDFVLTEKSSSIYLNEELKKTLIFSVLLGGLVYYLKMDRKVWLTISLIKDSDIDKVRKYAHNLGDINDVKNFKIISLLVSKYSKVKTKKWRLIKPKYFIIRFRKLLSIVYNEFPYEIPKDGFFKYRDVIELDKIIRHTNTKNMFCKTIAYTSPSNKPKSLELCLPSYKYLLKVIKYAKINRLGIYFGVITI